MQPPGYICKLFSKFNEARPFVFCLFCVFNHTQVLKHKPLFCHLPTYPLYCSVKTHLARSGPHIIKSVRSSMKCNHLLYIRLVHMNMYKNRTYIHAHRKYTHLKWVRAQAGPWSAARDPGPQRPGPGPSLGLAHARCVYYVRMCTDVCTFAQIRVYQVYSANGLH